MKSYKLILFAFVATFLASCESELDLAPKQSLDSKDVLATESGVKQLLVGTYANVADGDIYGGRVLTSADLLGATANEDDSHIFWEGTFAACSDIFYKDMVNDNGFAEAIYRESYNVINNANIVIENVDKIADPAEQKVAIAEAKFLQALVYFDLVRYFALPYESGVTNSQLGVPLRPKAIYQYLNTDLSASRNSVEEVYTVVVNNLKAAYNDLPADNSFYADKYTAQALLARVYLQQGKYAEALVSANDVIANGGYTLSKSFGDAFNHQSKQGEDIFTIQNTTQTGDNQINNLYASEVNGGRGGDITVQSSFLKMFTDANDARRNFTYIDPTNDKRLTSKFTDQYGDVAIIRLAEMYLIRAEANVRLGSSTGATPLSDINRLKTRALAANLTAVTLDDVLKERQLELSFEGFLIHDIKRTKQSIASYKNFAYNDPKLVFPIPLREMNTNSKMVQNPGY